MDWFDHSDHVAIDDCAGDPDGGAFYDACEICAGGNTGIDPETDSSKCAVTALEENSAMDEVLVIVNQKNLQVSGVAGLSGEAQLVLYSSAGINVLVRTLKNSEVDVLLPVSLESGVYFAHVFNGNVHRVFKVFVD